MDWSTVFTIAAGLTTLIGFSAFCVSTYLWVISTKRERSLQEIVAGEGVVRPGDVLVILKQFATDEARLQALQATLHHGESFAQEVLKKVKIIDGDLHAVVESQSLSIRLSRAATLIIVLAAIIFAAGYLAQPQLNGDTWPPPSKPDVLSDLPEIDRHMPGAYQADTFTIFPVNNTDRPIVIDLYYAEAYRRRGEPTAPAEWTRLESTEGVGKPEIFSGGTGDFLIYVWLKGEPHPFRQGYRSIFGARSVNLKGNRSRPCQQQRR